MKKFIVFIFSIILLIGAVGFAGATSFTIGNIWSILDKINSGSEFSNLVTPSANTFDLRSGGTSGTDEVFANEDGRELGGSFGGSFLKTSHGYGGIISSVLNDILDSKQRHKKVKIIKKGKKVGTPVPEPSTILLVGIGLIGLAQVSRKKIKP